MKLSNDQLAMLQRTSEGSVSYEGLSDSDIKVLQYLSRLKYVHIESIGTVHSQDGFSGISYTPKSASITELGKSVLAEITEDSKRFNKKYRLDIIAIVLSSAALLISILSLIIK